MKTEILQNLLIDKSGVLREQHQGDKSRNLCHTSRMRNEYTSADTLIQLYTRLTPELRKSYAREKFAQWLEWYIAPQYVLPEMSAELHYDVRQILNNTEIQEWWWAMWRDRDWEILSNLSKSYQEALRKCSKKNKPVEARLNAAHWAAEEYMIFHSSIFNTGSENFFKLEFEYGLIIAKAK